MSRKKKVPEVLRLDRRTLGWLAFQGSASRRPLRGARTEPREVGGVGGEGGMESGRDIR